MMFGMPPLREARMLLFLRVSVAALAVAAWTGVLLRFGFIRGFPGWAADFGAVRHAHSHLMYFGWVTLALMALIWQALPRYTGRARSQWCTVQMTATATVALLSFPAFWANGYGLTEVGALRLPLGSLAAALNGLTWYLFIGLYAWETRRVAVRGPVLGLWDGALLLMGVASLGAIGLGVLMARGVQDPTLYEFALHLFLDLFALGWFTLGLLGVLWSAVDSTVAIGARLPVGSLVLALIPTFLLGVSSAVLTPSLFWIAACANVVAALLIGRHLWLLWRLGQNRSGLDRFALICLAVHLATALLLLWPGFWRWAGTVQLRVFYLHNFLLGWVSSGLLGVILPSFAPAGSRATRLIQWGWIGGSSLMLLALLGLGLVTVLPLRPLFLLRLAAWSSILPATAASIAFLAALRPLRAPRLIPGSNPAPATERN